MFQPLKKKLTNPSSESFPCMAASHSLVEKERREREKEDVS